MAWYDNRDTVKSTKPYQVHVLVVGGHPVRHPAQAPDDLVKQRIVDAILRDSEWFYELVTKDRREIPGQIDHTGVARSFDFVEFEITTDWELCEDDGWWPTVTVRFRLDLCLDHATLISDQSGPDWSIQGPLFLRGLHDQLDSYDSMDVMFDGAVVPIPAC
jgi:hypothetical protein